MGGDSAGAEAGRPVLGEISPKGSLSWSDFSHLKAITATIKPRLL
jgi:hypothetical protein